MSKHKKYTPKHRQAPPPGMPTKALRNSVVLSTIAVGATGVAVGGGLVSGEADSRDVDVVSADPGPLGGDDRLTAAIIAKRENDVSRSDRRDDADPAKAAALATGSTDDNAFTRTENGSDDDPRDIARALLSEFGFGQDQFGCLDRIWTQESGWRVDADNPTSSAYGIPQALPGSKMASAGADWQWNAETQIRWGLGYIADRYGTPCNAWGFKQGHGWY